MKHIHLVGLTNSEKFRKRLNGISKQFEFELACYNHADELNENLETSSQVLAYCYCPNQSDTPSDIAGTIQVLKYASPLAYTVLILEKKLNSEHYDFIKKSGADLILFESDVYDSSILDYLLSQVIRGSLIPVKPQDLTLNSKIDFNIYTILPLNKKIVPVLFKNEAIGNLKFSKLQKTKELYVSRNEIQIFQKYIESHVKLTAEGINQRSRIIFLSLCKSHFDFITCLWDKSESTTFTAGKNLLDQCMQIAEEMLTSLSSVPDPWSIINNSTIGETGTAERSPAVASMAALMTLNLAEVSTNETILAGLLADIGLVTLPPEVIQNLTLKGPQNLTPEETTLYANHPLSSIEKCLERRLPLSEKIKQIISCTHERFDKKGFPAQINPTQIPKESQIIQYSEFIDQKLIIRMGEKSKHSDEVQIEVIESELNSKRILDLTISYDLKKYLKNMNFEKSNQSKKSNAA